MFTINFAEIRTSNNESFSFCLNLKLENLFTQASTLFSFECRVSNFVICKRYGVGHRPSCYTRNPYEKPSVHSLLYIHRSIGVSSVYYYLTRLGLVSDIRWWRRLKKVFGLLCRTMSQTECSIVTENTPFCCRWSMFDEPIFCSLDLRHFCCIL